MKSLSERLDWLETKVEELTLALEHHMGRSTVAVVGRPTLEQAKSCAGDIGITEEEAVNYWHSREASDWMRSMANGTTPVGKNWQSDMRQFVLSSREQGVNKLNGSTTHARPKQETVWHLQQSLNAVNEQITDIDSTVIGAWGTMSRKNAEERAKLVERRRELKRKIAGLGE